MQQKSLSLGPDFAGLELAYLDWGEPPRRGPSSACTG